MDFWVQAILSSSTNPSPVPSSFSSISNDENSNFNSGFENYSQILPMFWNPAIVQQLLAICQLPTAQLTEQFSPKKPEPLIPNNRKRVLNLSDPPSHQQRRIKSRKLGEDTVTNSPVSGMFIKEESDVKPVEELQKEADLLDETAAYVEVTEESRQKIGEIPNVIGDCVCRLCKVKYEDVFRLAKHKCPRIAHEEYKCPDCEKVFSCPANLASHRRWHKPRSEIVGSAGVTCDTCFANFPSKKMLKQHVCQQRSPLQELLTRGIVPVI